MEIINTDGHRQRRAAPLHSERRISPAIASAETFQ
jgi:hypothetical protein